MRLAKLAQGIATQIRPPAANAGDTADPLIGAITDDSRTCTPGCLFVARSGTLNDGATFLDAAIAAGAAAVALENPPTSPLPVPALIVNDAPLALAQLAERLAGSPTSKLALIGVTGTNGKSTIVHLIERALARLGTRCGLVGSVESFDGEHRVRARLTTPPAHELSALFARMVANGCTAAAMEVSSHALDQRRAAGLNFDIALFTNLTGDHLDYHGDMETYARAKARLFAMLPPQGLAIVHTCPPWSEVMLEHARCRVITCGEGQPARADLVEETLTGQCVRLTGPWGTTDVRTRLIGSFNAANTLQAALAVHALTACTAAELAHAFDGITGPAGRLEPVHTRRDDVSVFVDFAHTDDALANAINAARTAMNAAANTNTLWVVFGAGGDRDRTKRPRMASAVAQRADRVVVTSDNPRTEDPHAIIADVVSGLSAEQKQASIIESDRAAAIAMTLAEARPGDVILICGKGHERTQIIADPAGGTRTIDFDDATHARKGLDLRLSAGCAS